MAPFAPRSHPLITFSGTGYTIPYSCYGTQAERSLASLLIPKLTNSSDTALGTIWAGTGALAQACYETRQDIGEYVGTAFVARDMIRIAEALDDDGLLRYYGKCLCRWNTVHIFTLIFQVSRMGLS